MARTRTDSRTRRAAIIELVRTRHVGTQAELQRLLRAQGFVVTQATLSRDLAQIGARRAALPGGGSAYEVDGVRARTGAEPVALAAMAELVLGVRDAAALVVVHTRPAAAPAICSLLDQARLPSILGTIAGDDTIFIVPERRTRPRELVSELEQLFGREA